MRVDSTKSDWWPAPSRNLRNWKDGTCRCPTGLNTHLHNNTSTHTHLWINCKKVLMCLNAQGQMVHGTMSTTTSKAPKTHTCSYYAAAGKILEDSVMDGWTRSNAAQIIHIPTHSDPHKCRLTSGCSYRAWEEKRKCECSRGGKKWINADKDRRERKLKVVC